MDKIAIIGAGPAGIFCALQILETKFDCEITIFEKNEALKTLLVTGNGRCNITHKENDNIEFAKNYPRGEKFLYSIFSRHNYLDTLSYFEKIGVETYTQDDDRIFPKSNSAAHVRKKMLEKLSQFKNVKIIKREIKKISELDEFHKIVIASGSKGGYDLARQFNHTITPLAPSLLGYITKEKFKAGSTINIDNLPLLFTHFGVSGPYIFKYSSINAYKKLPFILELGLFNAQDVFCAIHKNQKKEIKTVLCDFLPKSLVQEIAPDKKCANITKEEVQNLSKLKLTVIGVNKKGETVKAGGVPLNEIDKNCSSKINKKVYFCGEILDIDGFCGGFNLQNCWSSAYVVAQNITKT